MNETQQTFEEKAANALTRKPVEETPKQQAQTATAALTEVVNEGEAPNLDEMKRADTLVIWESFEQRVNKLKITAETLKVEDASQTAEIAIARATRIQFKNLRVEIEHKRIALVADLKARSGKIDKDAKKLKDICQTLEDKLLADEQFIERQEEARKQALRDERVVTLKEYGSDGSGFNLGEMEQEAFAAFVNSLRQLRDDKIKAAKETEEQRIAKEKADAEERERTRLAMEEALAEQNRLKAEIEAKQAAHEAKMEAERKATEVREAHARKERESAEAKLREEAAERERIATEKARKEREALEAKAKADRAKADKERAEAQESARKEREARQKVENELAEKRRLEAEESSRQREEAEKAKRAPDKEKILALARYIREIELPMVGSDEAGAIIAKIESQAEKFAAWIEKEAATL